MSTIWILENKGRYDRKIKIYRNESQLLKAISTESDQEIFEYELKSSTKSSDYFKTKDRDIQLRSVLGELDKNEEVINNFIGYYEQVAPDNRQPKRIWRNGQYMNVDYSLKDEMLRKMKKYQSDKKSFCKLLIDNKKHFICDVSNSVEWYTNLLKVHNFMSYMYDMPRWDSVSKKYIKIDSANEVVKSNFHLAKKGLRKKK